jgi:hypothetical protein
MATITTRGLTGVRTAVPTLSQQTLLVMVSGHCLQQSAPCFCRAQQGTHMRFFQPKCQFIDGSARLMHIGMGLHQMQYDLCQLSPSVDLQALVSWN